MNSKYTTTSQPGSSAGKNPHAGIWRSVFGALLLLVNSGELAASQVISATQVIVVDTQSALVSDGSGSDLTAIGGTRAKAIGGTRAKAIGGTRAKAIGGTRAKAIGGTRAKAIGGTRAKAIGGTRAKAIGGTRAKAIGGTRAKAIGGTRAKAIGGTRLLALADTEVQAIQGAELAVSAHSLIAPPVFESAPVSFMGEAYDWIVIAPLQYIEQGRGSVLGYPLEFQDENMLQSLFNSQRMVIVANRHSDGEVVSLATSDTFVSGVTEVVTAAQVESIDTSTGRLTLRGGVIVDYTQLLSSQSQPTVDQGDFVFVRGHLY
jgi:hypothetical protein